MRNGIQQDPAIGPYLHKLGRYPLLSAEEEISLSRKIKEGCKIAEEQMVLANLRLVVSLAKRYQHRGVPLMDLIEEGNLALYRAIEGFDPEKGYRFSTYATWWIIESLDSASRNLTRTIRLPERVDMQLYKIRQLEKDTGKTDVADIAEALGVSARQAKSLMHTPSLSVSIDAPVSQDGSMCFGDTLASDDNIETQQDRSETLSLIEQCLAHLPERDAKVLQYRFGLQGTTPKTLQEIGDELGVTRERVRQLENQILQKLKIYFSHLNLCADDMLFV